jgi:2-keto-4-pentenoate hydratase/2-oxohepta-3-ene-1,7-dioic acid hydratase in catechol pathway
VRLVRVSTRSGPRAGVVDGDDVLELAGDPADGRVTDTVIGRLAELTFLTPAEPTKVIGVGRNYNANLAEKGRANPTEPFLFIKGPNAVVGDGATIQRPAGVERLEYEAELAVVIGRRARRLTAEDWRHHDLSVRDWQTMDRQWVLAKSSDTLCPIGPWVETDPGDPDDLAVRARVNGELRQDGRTSDMVFDIGALLVSITATITLEPGDVVLTGTPAGSGHLVDGDVVEVEVEGVGTLRNRVVQT